MSRSRRIGFTLIELLVVITIIGMLMALLVPATGAVRATMQRLACANNQRQIGIALNDAVNATRVFPGYRNVLVPVAGNVQNNRVGSWVITILPGLQRNDLYQNFRDATVDPTNASFVVPYMEVLVCPSDPPENTTVPALDYIVNCGKPDGTYGDTAANGLFFDHAPVISSSSATAPKSINMTKNKIIDGDEYTLMVSENMNLVRLLDPATGWGQTAIQSEQTKVAESMFGFTWWNDNMQGGSVYPYRKINGGRISDPSLPNPTADDLARPASNHNGGVNVCFASGRESWLRDDIPYYVYQQLMTPDGANAIPVAVDASGNPYTLLDGDFKP